MRGRQVLKWIYEGGAATFDDMNNIPKALRAKLGKVATVGALEVCFRSLTPPPVLDPEFCAQTKNMSLALLVFRGTIVNGTYGIHKKLYI